MLPSSLGSVEVTNGVKTPFDAISQFSKISSSVKNLFTCNYNWRTSTTMPVDDDVNKKGYDSDGLHPPWKDSKEIDFNGFELDKEPFRAPILSTDTKIKNFCPNWLLLN